MVYTKIFQRLKGLGANRVYSRFYSFCLTVKLRKFEGETSSGTKSWHSEAVRLRPQE